jgi:predicted AAA+ superfamily ATPase
MTTRKDQPHWNVERRAHPIMPEPAFIPLASHITTVRGALRSFESGKKLVVIYGPSGSGRTTVARQVARLVSSQPILVHHPETRTEPSENQMKAHLQTKSLKTPPLFVFDSIQLKHLNWAWWLRDQASESAKILVVSSTAWWLEHAECLKDHAEGLGLKLLSVEEVEHLSNGLRWLKAPSANKLDHAQIQNVDEQSEGLARSVANWAKSN